MLIEILLVTLNDNGKQDETGHKLKIKDLMDKHSVLLDLQHPITTRDTSFFWLRVPNVVYFKGFLN